MYNYIKKEEEKTYIIGSQIHDTKNYIYPFVTRFKTKNEPVTIGEKHDMNILQVPMMLDFWSCFKFYAPRVYHNVKC